MLLRSCVVIFLMLLIAGQSMQNILVFLDFKLNQNYVATQLCENRNKPQMHCNGKCQLSKELKKADEESNTSNTGLKQFKQVELFSELISNIDLSHNTFTFHQTDFYHCTVCEGCNNSAFHPPSLA